MYKKYAHLDADNTVFFDRQLEKIEETIYETKFPQYMARTLFPVDFTGGKGIDTITYYMLDQVGMAKIIVHGTEDVPMADVTGRAYKATVKTLASGYQYTIDEINNAAQAGTDLDGAKAAAAKRAILAAENLLAFTGDADLGIPGFLTNNNVNIYVVPNGASASPLWVNKTPEEILRDLHACANKPSEVTKNVEAPDTLLLPSKQFNLVASTPFSTLTGVTILRTFLESSPYIKNVFPVGELEGRGAGGTDVMVAYARNPLSIQLRIPSDFEQLDVQPQDLRFKRPCMERFGGVVIRYPLSVCKAEGI